MSPAERTLDAHAAAAAAAHPDTRVVFDSDARPDQATLSELWDDAQALARGLRARGVGSGDVVAMQLPNRREASTLPTAVWLCGAVLLPIVSTYGPREVGFVLEQAGASMLVVEREFRGSDSADLLAALPRLPALRHRVVVGAVPPGTTPFDALPTAGDVVEGPGELDAAAVLVYTSGTTADPKGIRLTHRGLHHELVNTVALDAGPGVVYLSAFPPGHIAGVLGVLRTVALATPTVAMDVWNPRTAALLVERYAVTSSVGAPIFLQGLLEQAAAHGIELASLREYATGAAGVPPNLIRRADERGIRAYRMYGSSEHPTVSSGRPDDPLDKRADTDGRPTVGTEIRVVDDEGRDVPAGVDGEILTRGPERFTGYTDAALDDGSFVDDWFRTGDVGRLDAEGYLTVTDRVKDLVIRGGENISSREVEDILAEHPAVAEVAVVAVPDERLGERVCACVVLRVGATLDLAEVQDHFRRCGAARHKTPEYLLRRDSLPRTAAGKVRKPDLRVAASQLRPPAHGT